MFFPTTMNLYEHAALKLAEAQHAPGVTVRMNPTTYRVEYIRPDGTIVPGYKWFLQQEYAGLQRGV
jgi:hypothetical protein